MLLLLLECGNTSYMLLYALDIPLEKQLILALFMFLAFAAKIPVFPLHI